MQHACAQLILSVQSVRQPYGRKDAHLQWRAVFRMAAFLMCCSCEIT